MYQKSRESVIARQQQELLELSTPVVKLWDGVLAVPLIGTLDSARTQIVMETLPYRMIVDTGRRACHYRHHRRAHCGYFNCTAPAKDCGCGQVNGRGLHYQRCPPANCSNHCPPRRRPHQRDNQGNYGGRFPYSPSAPRGLPSHGRQAGVRGANDVEHAFQSFGWQISYLLLSRWICDRLAMTLQDDLTAELDCQNRRARRTDRHLFAGHRGLVYWPRSQQYLSNGLCFGRDNGCRRDAACCRDYLGRAWSLTSRRPHRP